MKSTGRKRNFISRKRNARVSLEEEFWQGAYGGLPRSTESGRESL